MKTILLLIIVFIAGLYFGNLYHLCSDNIHIQRCEKERTSCENKLLMKGMGITENGWCLNINKGIKEGNIAGTSDEGMRRTWNK